MQTQHAHLLMRRLWASRLLFGFVLIGAGAITACTAVSALPDQTQSATIQTVKIKIQNFKFVPATVTVVPGTRIVWTNLDEVPHSIVSDNGMFATSAALNQNDSYSVVLSSPGNYPYHCGIHTFMQAEIQVLAAKPQNPSRARP